MEVDKEETQNQQQKHQQVHLFYCVESEELARKVAGHSDLITLQSINWRNFDDGFPNLFINNAEDLRGQHGDVATAFTMARILSNIPISRGGPTSLVIYDIHALQERFYFGDQVLPLFVTGIPLLKQRLLQLPESDKIAVAFPDDGAWKRFHKLLDHFPMVGGMCEGS
ncbi:hypothetical protein OIU76_001685 [Salix suchowensis]|nr:hypothetical protein OIU76_001685 [Salix suchowensis]